jgi:undecaprenyl pyrophosphate synthase
MSRQLPRKADAHSAARELTPGSGSSWYLTLYAFSADNWRLPVFEIEKIFWLLRAFLLCFGGKKFEPL